MSLTTSLWDWTRFWLSASAIAEKGDAGFLPTHPSSDYQTLLQLSDRRLLVLLGEPGSGKSVEIHKEYERISNQLGPGGRVIYLDGRTTVHSERTLDRIWFHSDGWKQWHTSSDDIWVFFDGFDESAQHVGGLGGIIDHELHRSLANRRDREGGLFLRIASRSTGWQPALGAKLSHLLYPDESGNMSREQYTFHLAPPRWDDIALAAESRNLDGRDFCKRVKERGIESLALRPSQLEWLLNIVEAGRQLPDDKVGLYWEGMRQLCQDPLHATDVEHLRALAGRVAFVTMFGGLQSVWLDHDRGNVSPNCIPLSRFAGGAEHTDQGDEVPISQDLLRALVQSGLFTTVNPPHAIWAHQTYPEYLAARYVVTRGLPLSQMTGLITNPLDPSQKVLPGMLEVAAWMASMDEDVFNHFLQHDPGALVESDVALTDPDDRRRLVRAFLSALANGHLLRTRWPQKGHYASLYFPGMGDILTPFITDKALGKDVRDTAIDIAVDCGLAELGDVLAAIALDVTDLEVVRRSAAWAVTRIGNEESRQRLKPLVHAPIDEDPFEELKGCALRANWPNSLTIQQVLGHLTIPKWYGLGAYRLFLSSHFVRNLSYADLLPALEWLDQQGDWGERSYDLHELEARLVQKAMEQLDVLAIREWITRRVAANLSKYRPMFGEGVRGEVSASLIASSERRQELLQGLARISSDTANAGTIAYMFAESLRGHPAWLDDDFPWMVQHLQKSDTGSVAERFWLALLRGSFSINDLEQTSLLYDLYSTDRFKSQLADLFEPIDRRTAGAAQLRKSWYGITETRDQDRESSAPEFNTEQLVLEVLTRVDGNQSGAWWQIDERLKYDERGIGERIPLAGDVRELPGWSRCSPATQRRIIDTAPAFLRGHEPDNAYIGTNTCFLADHAAYRALGLLLVERPQELDALSAETWSKLGPLILGKHPRATGEDIPHQRALLERATKHGFDPIPWLAIMASRANESSSFYFSPALGAVTSLASDLQVDQLGEALIRPEMPFSALTEALRVLGERRVRATFRRALEVIEEIAAREDGGSTAAALVAVLLDFVDPAIWNDLWELMASNDALFDRALLDYAHWHRDAAEWARDLDESSVARLYQRLVQRFPPSQDRNIGTMHFVSSRESLGRWREDLLSSLAMRGTWEAVTELHALVEQFPDIEWLPVRVAQAEEEARRRTWQPPSVNELFSLVRSPEARIIGSPAQLHDVILESLGRLQHALTAESPAAVDLWNVRGTDRTGAPKDELLVSDYIKRHLDRDLGHLGIIVNREVENRIRNEIDLYVQYVSQASPTPVTLVCEVKGCWHRDLYSSMASQLHERYMKQQGISDGIYVVAFFDGERWEPSDHKRRHQARSHSLDELRAAMTAQATELTNNIFQVTPVVLDCTY